MHDSMIETTGMDGEPQPAHDHAPYSAGPNWVNVSSYGHQNSMSDYSNFGYMPSTSLASEAFSRLAPSPTSIQPQPQQQSQSHTPGSEQSPEQSHPPQLPMLIMPSHAWPSMLTNPATYPTPPLSIPAPAPSSTTGKPLRPTTSTPRRTLTDDDRRRMCRYHEENPTAKQLDIGRMFGVERSTVSKVLRQKEKYLNRKEKSPEPVRRTKGKLPDIERALASWARKAQQSGMAITDGEIWEKAQHFAHGVSPGENIQKLGSSWLEKFKQKHAIGQPKISRRASETSLSTAKKMAMRSPSLGQSQPSSAISPASPMAQPSPLSGPRSDDDLKDGIPIYSFRTDLFKSCNSQSATSLSSVFTDTGTSSFSGSAVSPTGHFSFSPDSNVGSFLPPDHRHVPAGPESSFQRPRSQTFPTLDIECLTQHTTGAEPDTPKYAVASTAPSSALESPSRDLDARHFALDSVVSHQLHHSYSNGSLTAGSNGGLSGSTMVSPISMGSSSGSPTLEDARRGLDIALNYVQRSVSRYDESDLMAVIRFFENVGLRQYAQQAKTSGSLHPMSGLSRIPEGGEVEMSNAPPTTSAKVETMMA